jgi:V8-like Glu-specific endopeptidase
VTKNRLAIAVIIVVGAFTAAIPAAARATAAAPPARGAVDPNTIVTDTITDTPAQVAAFWTPKRLAAAKNMDLVPASGPITSSTPASSGPVESMPPMLPAKAAAGAATPDSTSIADGLPGKHSRVWGFTHSKPAVTIGELFFDTGSSMASCTATVITAPNKSVIWTAGHCVSNGHGKWYTKFEFQPDRNGNSEPYGEFAAKYLATPSGYSKNHLSAYDYAAIALDPGPNGPVANLTGSQGFIMGGSTYNWPSVYTFGYPGVLYPGKTQVNPDQLRYCTGPATNDSAGTMMYFKCDMGNGSSGGPLLYRLSAKTGGGWLVGNVSVGTSDNYDRWSPDLTKAAVTIYDKVKRK